MFVCERRGIYIGGIDIEEDITLLRYYVRIGWYNILIPLYRIEFCRTSTNMYLV